MRQVVLMTNPDGRITALVPSLPGCVSEGDTAEEALANVRDAIDLWEEDMREDGEPIPDDMPLQVAIA
jgi:predicted RNase H-like HicB family nuclease